MAGKKKAQKAKTAVGSSYLRPTTFRKYYATNVQVDQSEEDLRVAFTNERLRLGDGWHYVLEAQVILTPQAAKLLQAALGNHLERFEKEHGAIKVTRTPADGADSDVEL